MKNIIIGLVIAAILAIVGWYWYKKRKSNTDTAATKESKPTTTEPTKPTSVATKPTLATAEQIAQSAAAQLTPQLTLQIER